MFLQGYKTVLIDADNQANTSYTMGYDTEANSDIVTLFDVLGDSATMKEAIQPVKRHEMDLRWSIVPAEEKLSVYDAGIMPIKKNACRCIKNGF